MQDYDKPHRNYDEQVSILRSRGLEIPDPAKAALFLSQISYYRFSAYAIPFWQYRDHFREGVSFPQLVQLYQLDEQLRERIDALLTCIEILFRTRMTYCLGRDLGPFGHYDSKYFYSEEKHKIWMERLAKEVNRSNETFIDHYKITYHGYPKLPIWMASEVMSMGRLSRLYDDLRKNFQTPLAKEFGIQPIVLVSWLHVLTVLRNICAHHGRLWNRELPVKPLIPNKSILWKDIRLKNSRIAILFPIIEWLFRRSELPLTGLQETKKVMEKIADMKPEFSETMGLDLLPKTGLHF